MATFCSASNCWLLTTHHAFKWSILKLPYAVLHGVNTEGRRIEASLPCQYLSEGSCDHKTGNSGQGPESSPHKVGTLVCSLCMLGNQRRLRNRVMLSRQRVTSHRISAFLRQPWSVERVQLCRDTKSVRYYCTGHECGFLKPHSAFECYHIKEFDTPLKSWVDFQFVSFFLAFLCILNVLLFLFKNVSLKPHKTHVKWSFYAPDTRFDWLSHNKLRNLKTDEETTDFHILRSFTGKAIVTSESIKLKKNIVTYRIRIATLPSSSSVENALGSLKVALQQHDSQSSSEMLLHLTSNLCTCQKALTQPSSVMFSKPRPLFVQFCNFGWRVGCKSAPYLPHTSSIGCSSG